MRRIEVNSDYLGVSLLQLMENSGAAVAEEILRRHRPGSRVVIFAGPGRNGGDGMVVARHLAGSGYSVELTLIGREVAVVDESCLKNWAAVKQMSSTIRLNVSPDSSGFQPAEADVLVDAMLGTGAQGTLRPPLLQAVQAFNNSKGFKIALDIPTGVDADSGEVLGEAVKANLTVTLHKPKKGLERAAEYVGELVTKGIGIPPEAESFVGPGDVIPVYDQRPSDSHKGDFGRLVLVGGSETYSGAPALAGLSAIKTGVDLVYAAVPDSIGSTVSSYSPNLICVKLPGGHLAEHSLAQVRPFVARADAVVIGPGLGLHRDTRDATLKLIGLVEEEKKPLVLDADGLKAFASGGKRRLKVPAVLTPHAGEFEILTGKMPPASIEESAEVVRSAAKDLGAVVVLKGHVDVISDGETVRFNRTGNPYMTVGGTGDTLTGMIGSFLAQKKSLLQAACAAVFLNGLAGDIVVKSRGPPLVPTDIIDAISRAIGYCLNWEWRSNKVGA